MPCILVWVVVTCVFAFVKILQAVRLKSVYHVILQKKKKSLLKKPSKSDNPKLTALYFWWELKWVQPPGYHFQSVKTHWDRVF